MITFKKVTSSATWTFRCASAEHQAETSRFTLEDIHLSSEIPQPDEPDDVPGPVTHLEATETLVVSAAWHIPPLRPTLPENPTAAERWKYLVEVQKQRAEH